MFLRALVRTTAKARALPRPPIQPYTPLLRSRSFAQESAPKSGTTTQDLSSMSLKAAALCAFSGIGLLVYFFYEKERMETERETSRVSNEGYGRPKVGGSFALVDHEGNAVSDLTFRGKYMLFYFGYTFCPDVCPEELDKMAEIYDTLAKKGLADDLVPLFVSCDPKRDSVSSLKEYLHEFHPKFLGLTGTHNQILKMARLYRMYFSAPPRAIDEDEDDYLVDHSIFFYLMGPDNQFLAHYGRNEDAQQISAKIMEEMALLKKE